MKVPSLIFFCLVLALGSNRVSDAASISKRAEGKSTSSESGSVAASLTIDDIANVMSFVFRTLGQFGPIRLIGEALGLPLNMLLSPILDALGMILMPVRRLLSKSLSTLAPALADILLQLGRLLDELLDNVADILVPASSSSFSSTSLSIPSNLPSVSSNVHRRRRRSLTNILPLAMANLLRVSTGSTTSANSGNDLISTFSNLLSCGTSTSDKLPSANEIRTDPTRSLNVIICFTVNRIINVGEGVMERVIPSLIESLKSINETGIIPPPLSIWIRTLVILYEMGNTLRNGG